MRGCELKVLVCALILLTSSTSANDGLKKITSGSLAFARKFLDQFPGPENVAVSPLSAYMALALAKLGARGQTEAELNNGLGLESSEEISSAFPELITRFSSTKEARVVVANRIFVQEKFPAKPKFNEDAKKIFKAAAQNVDFASSSTAEIINNWVKNETRNRITEIVDKESLGGEALMLVNILYFRGPWRYRFFSPSIPRPFYLDNSKSVDTLFMSKEDYYGYAELKNLDAELIELAYKDEDYSLVIISPKSKEGLAELAKKLSTADISDLIGQATKKELTLHLPKFKIEMTAKLNQPLKAMGFENIFTENADLSGISSEEKLFVSKVLQKTYFEIHENGTEAAASTSIRIVPASAQLVSQEKVVTCDHPFVFYLMYKSNLVLFEGKLMDPSSEKNALRP